MPRLGFRNLLGVFKALQIDRPAIGPKVSEDIQLTYQLDDVGMVGRGWYMAGVFQNGAAPEFPVIELEVQNEFGLLMHSAGLIKIGVDLEGILWTQDNPVQMTATAPGIILEPLVSNGPPSQTIVRVGRQLVAEFPQSPAGSNVFRFATSTSGQFNAPGLFVRGRVGGPSGPGPSRFLLLAGALPGLSTALALMWQEPNVAPV